MSKSLLKMNLNGLDLQLFDIRRVNSARHIQASSFFQCAMDQCDLSTETQAELIWSRWQQSTMTI